MIRVTHVNGLDLALFHVSNLSVRNFRIFLLMYLESLCGIVTGVCCRPRYTVSIDVGTGRHAGWLCEATDRLGGGGGPRRGCGGGGEGGVCLVLW